jgi:hypothetical protein
VLLRNKRKQLNEKLSKMVWCLITQ